LLAIASSKSDKRGGGVILKPCPFCHKEIPRSITACPYCHRDEQGKPVIIDTAATEVVVSERELQALLKDLASEDPYVRDQAVLRASQLGIAIVPSLMTVLGDFAKPRLSGVALALGKIGDKRAIAVLAQAAKMGDEDLKMAAVKALAQLNQPEVLPVLLAEAERPHPLIQSYLAHFLGTFHDARVTAVLSRLAVHPNREIAFQASCALGEAGEKGSIGALQTAWRNGDVLVRAASAASLRRLGSRPSRFSKTLMAVGVMIFALLGGGAGYFFYK
jgi:HEAT repeat protein